MRTLASTNLVEIELHAWDPGDETASRIHEAAADVPWEYLLSAGSRAVGRYHPILISRLLRNGAQASGAAPGNILFIESAPGRLEDVYEFDLERDAYAPRWAQTEMAVSFRTPLDARWKFRRPKASASWPSAFAASTGTCCTSPVSTPITPRG
jgi:hypothetical protein